MNEQVATVSHAKDSLIEMAIRFGPRLFTALLIIVIGLFVSGWLSRWLAQFLGRRDLEPPLRLLLSRIVWALCALLFALLALQNLGVELLPLLAGLGVIGAGVALATQGVLSNIVAGLSIIFAKPFRVGEYIAIAGVEGVVESVTLFNTTLGHVDLSRVVVPNRKVVGEILHNYGRIRQLEVTIGVAYDSDIATVLELIRAALQANPRVLREPQAVVQPMQFGNSSVSIAVRPWVAVQDQVAATGEIHAAVLAALRAYGVVIPPPQREVRLIGATA
ncbi:MAG TPA: mechanosensitive ion channel family protein [Steroidobacteraceae bacterium]|jgi:small conductance mechanosensitive channel|nr:mechanosensitive ion channel family protein [Steroidobacteraceae bacterium]